MGDHFYREYDAEMKRLQKQIMALPEYNFIKPKVKKETINWARLLTWLVLS